MFFVEYHPGGIVTERDTTWHDLPPDKPIYMVFLCNKNIITGLVEMDKYWFSNQAVATADGMGTKIGQILGGEKNGKITEIWQSVATGDIRIFDHPKARITVDHRPGGKVNESLKGRDNLLTRVFRRFK